MVIFAQDGLTLGTISWWARTETSTRVEAGERSAPTLVDITRIVSVSWGRAITHRCTVRSIDPYGAVESTYSTHVCAYNSIYFVPSIQHYFMIARQFVNWHY